ncbi:Canalicular multispecific organic anion transporter 2, partial [Podila horticola]
MIDTTEAWIDFILQHGSFIALLGVPALVAIYFIEMRINRLRKLEPHSYGHRYKTRSSDTLFLYYITAIALSVITIYILHDQESAFPKLPVPTVIQHLILFTSFITLGFVAEAWPRSHTTVQTRAREAEHLSEYDQANLCSRLTYHYVDQIVSLGAKRPLVPTDIDHTTPDYLRTRVSYSIVSQAWEQEVAKAQDSNGKHFPSFFWTVIQAYRARVLVALFLRCVAFRLPFLTPILFRRLLAFITDYHRAANSDGKEDVPALRGGLVIAFTLFAISMVGTVLGAMAMQWSYDLGMEARGASIAMVYRKALKLSPAARQKSTLGEITNHMSVDAEKWINGSSFMPAIFFVPVDIAISMYLLYQLFGWSSVAGLVVVAVVVPLNAKMASFLHKFQNEKLKWMDTRIRTLTEILSSIKIVKLYGWEDAFREKIEALRTKELLAHKRFVTIRAVLAIVFSSVTLLMALATFSLYATIGGPGGTPGKMTAEVIFVGITLFGVLNRPLGRVTTMISQTIAVTVACRRIQNFLLLEEIDTTIVHRYGRQVPRGDSLSPALAVSIDKGTFAWEKPIAASTLTETIDENQPLLSRAPSPFIPSPPTLRNIDLRINDGSLTAIVGRIGQGKSSLLSQAWIVNATLKDNILFGQPFDQEKYDRIVFSSGLVPDFAMLPAGDQTEIGERGINLSGGQKQRVSLARAAYQDADIYLLDDPLSAVDAHVSQHLWDHLIGPKGLLKAKTRLLVTHGVHHLEYVDQIVVFKDGTISETGHYQELLEAGGAFYQLIKEYSAHVSTSAQLDDEEGSFITVVDPSSGNSSSSASTVLDKGDEDKKDESKSKDKSSSGGELVAVEKMQNGRVGWSVIQAYSRAASYINALNCLLLFILGQAAHIGTNLWLRYWITETGDEENGDGRSIAFYLLGYAFFVFLFMVLDVSANYSVEVICGIRASRVLFQKLLNRILQMPMSFFDTTPLGRIINRLSSDIDAIDMQLPNEMNDLLRFLAMIAGTFFVIAYSTPAFLLMIPPLGLVYFLIQDHYIRCSASLKRLYSVSKSPLYQHFSESLAGVSTIRVVRGLDSQFVLQNESRADTIVNRLNIYTLVNRWLAVRIEFLGNTTVLLASVLAVLNAKALDPTLSALALTYAINIVGNLTYLVRTVNEVQNVL